MAKKKKMAIIFPMEFGGGLSRHSHVGLNLSYGVGHRYTAAVPSQLSIKSWIFPGSACSVLFISVRYDRGQEQSRRKGFCEPEASRKKS